MRPALVIMLKEPRPGRVKTRLGRDIGMVAAAWWFRHQTARLIRQVQDPRWHVILAIAPDRAGLASRVWPAHLPRIAQGGGDLGDRMARLMRVSPAGPVCIIGGDIPGVRKHHIARAFKALGAHDAVFGPALDGGYWLIGLRRMAAIPTGFLQGVRWSTADALSGSMATLPGARIALVDTLRDVDTAADLHAAR
ncbi:TIGR04282 family arsenosugar biosynthesis glycosyltransferase [Roseovarius arcticus]|uniref:TIGR04282 family arsenosugar biosynthesis glycosyltransferase n=1 Tax=Roseovarius arcticus TaxID=2547404 RepID=UPI00110FF9C5|nr:TIGR04282 family arsenosugar biosynthesis glycosyltransferase [Roseovarius arcticus]